MKTSPTLDMLIAKHVMGYQPAGAMSNGIQLVKTQDGAVLPLPRYSGYEGSAADLAEHLAANGHTVTAQWGDKGQRTVAVGNARRSDKTFPRALCHAALAAYGVKQA